jgi:hypothetical protein
VNAVFNSAEFDNNVAAMCSSATPSYRFWAKSNGFKEPAPAALSA